MFEEILGSCIGSEYKTELVEGAKIYKVKQVQFLKYTKKL